MIKVLSLLITLSLTISFNAQSLVSTNVSSGSLGQTINMTTYGTGTNWSVFTPTNVAIINGGDTVYASNIVVNDDSTFTADYMIPCNLTQSNVNYSLEVSDGQNFMTLPSSFLIKSMSANGSATNDNGGCDGTASVSPADGTAPYTTYWSLTAGTAATDSNLCAGSYSVQITDANGCLYDTTINVLSNPCGLFELVHNPLGNESSSGNCDGASQIIANNAAGPVTYEWSHGPTTDVLYNLCGGSYWVYVVDNNGCSDTLSLIVETNGPCFGFEAITSPLFGESAPGACDAIVSIDAYGGQYPFTYEWSTANTTNVDSSLCSGNYWAVVTDDIGCSDTISFFVDSIYNPCIAYSSGAYNVINVSDTNSCDGSAFAGANYGTEPFSFEWSNAVTTETNNSLCFGFNWVVVTDANSCSDTATFYVDSIFNACNYYQVYIANGNNESGPGLCDGSAVAEGIWGTAPYTFVWSTAETTDSIGSLCAGTYSVTVTDANGCVDSTDYTVATDCSLDFSASIVNNVSCFGLNDGSIDAIANGTAPYLYSIDGGTNIDSTGLYLNLQPGNYTLLSEDDNGCYGEYNFTIAEPAPLSFTVNKTFPTCGANDGSAQVTGLTGGTAPYSYQWTNGAQTALSSNMAAGTFMVTVEDANGCDISETVNLSSSAAPSVNVNPISPTCNGLNNGSIDLTVTGGVAPITFDWSTGAQTEDVSNLLAGIYDVTISDAAGCVIVEVITLTDVAPINLSSVTKTLASCGLSDGSLTSNVTGGTAPYTYNWVTGGTSATESNLAAGSYLLTVTDVNGCVKSKTYSLSNAAAPVITVDNVNQPECEGGNGMIEVSVSGGTAPYTYAWSDGSSNQNLLSAIVGEYELVVTDAGGCEGVEYAELFGINLNAAEICLVSVDTATNGNLVVWTKDYGLGIAEYQIFKETAIANQFQYLQTVPFDSLSQYVDMAANPDVHSYKYKVRTIDSCGNASDFLALHKTIHLSAQMTNTGEIELSWDDYIGINYTQFYIHRFHPSTGWEVIDSVATNVHTYLDGAYPNLTDLEYSIVVLPDSPCTAEKAQDHNSTRSNAATVAFDNAGPDSGINTNEANSLSIHPNPTDGVVFLNIADSYQSMRIRIVDINGKMVTQYPVVRGINQQQLNIANLESGVYFIHAEIDNVNHVVKLIKQ